MSGRQPRHAKAIMFSVVIVFRQPTIKFVLQRFNVIMETAMAPEKLFFNRRVLKPFQRGRVFVAPQVLGDARASLAENSENFYMPLLSRNACEFVN